MESLKDYTRGGSLSYQTKSQRLSFAYAPPQSFKEENLDFLTNCGAALRTTKKYSLPVLLKVLIDDPSRLDMLRKNIKSIRKFDSAVNISNLVVDILDNNK